MSGEPQKYACLTGDTNKLLLKFIEPLVMARESKEIFLSDAGFISGCLRIKFEDNEVVFLGSEDELQKSKLYRLEHQKYQMMRYVDAHFESELGLRLASELEYINAARNANVTARRQYESERHHRWESVYEQIKQQCAKEVARFSTGLSRAESDEEVYAKVLQNYSCTHVHYAYEDTLQKRVEIIRTLIDQELGPLGFEFDKKLSSVKNLVYCKPLHGKFRLFVSSERSSLNPKKIESIWPIGFAFGIHCLTEQWPASGEWNDNGKRWTFRLGSFIPYGWECGPRSLPEIEANMRFDLFAYKLIANDFEAALRAGLAEAEAKGLITPAP